MIRGKMEVTVLLFDLRNTIQYFLMNFICECHYINAVLVTLAYSNGAFGERPNVKIHEQFNMSQFEFNSAKIKDFKQTIV